MFAQNRGRPEWYDVMQACENGHVITTSAVSRPNTMKKRCSTCDAATLHKCPKCQTDIQGKHHLPHIVIPGPSKPPEYCHNCGEAYPWSGGQADTPRSDEATAMDILLSWSGQSSHDVALALREWLPEVLPGCAPWVSSEDIAKGKRWSDVLHQQLGKTKVTVVCITPDNVRSPWLFYEAGFIAAKLGESAVCPYLLGVAGKLVSGTPLGLYQWTEADKKETGKLVRTLHTLLGSPHDATMLDGNFQAKWPQLKRKLDKVAEGFEAVEDDVTTTELPVSQQLTEQAKQLLIAACAEGRNKGKLGRSMTRGHKSGRAERRWTHPTIPAVRRCGRAHWKNCGSSNSPSRSSPVAKSSRSRTRVGMCTTNSPRRHRATALHNSRTRAPCFRRDCGRGGSV